MITDRQLQLICLVIALAGITGIFCFTVFSKPASINISDIKNDKLGYIVSVSGRISSYSTKDGHIFIDLTANNNTIPVVMFEQIARNQDNLYTLKKNDNITVEGKVLMYRNALEVEAFKIQT